MKILTTRRDSSVGIETWYGMDGPGIESRCGQDFPYPSRPDLGPTQPPIQGVKRPGRDVDQPPHLVPRSKKEKSNNFNPSRDLTACSRVNFTFTFTFYLPFQPFPLITSNNIWRSPQIMKFSTASMELHSIIPLFNLSWDSKYFLQYSVVEHTSIHSIFSFR